MQTWLPLLGTLVLGAIYVLNRRAFYWLLVEDHPVEWIQFAFLVFACLAAGCAAVRLARSGRYGAAALLVLVAVGCFGLAGEEISWAERVFSLEVPGELTGQNRQHELNLHNLVVGGLLIDNVSRVVELLLGSGGAVLALMARPGRSGPRSTWTDDLVPPMSAMTGFGLAVLYQAFMLGVGNKRAPVILYQEWVEFCLYLAMAVTVARCFTRAAAHRRSGAVAAEARSRRRPAGPVRAGRPLIAAAGVALAVAVVFAHLSAQSGLLPGNVPPSLVSLYGSS